MIFRVLCGECIEPLIECWTAAGPTCVALYYPTVLFGNFLVSINFKLYRPVSSAVVTK